MTMKVQKLLPFSLRVQIVTVLLLLQTKLAVSEEENKDDFDEELYSVIDSVQDGSLWTKSRHMRSVDFNRTTGNETFSDNSLWNDLWFECRKKPSFACVRTGVFKYLDKSLDKNSDFSLTDSLFFRKNNNKVNGFCENSEEERESCLRYNEEKLKVLEEERKINEISNKDRKSGEKKEKIEGANTENSTSDQEDENSAEEDLIEEGDGRSMNSLSYLSDILYDKGTHFLMTHDMEFQLPETFFGGGSVKIEPKHFIVGSEEEEEGTIVKIVVKPPPPPAHVIRGRVFHHLTSKLYEETVAKGLAHLFKLCHYYHTEHAKYHHHHHKIKHHHHHIKVPVPVPVPVHHHHPDIVYDRPYDTSGGGYDHHDYPPYPSNHVHSGGGEGDYDYPPSGGGHGQGGYHKDYGSYPHYGENEAHLASWGLGSNIHEAGVLDAKNQPAYYKNHPYGAYYPHDQAGYHSQQYLTKLQLLTPKPPPGASTIPVTYDPFYSPILQKIDNIFVQMGFNEEPCRERLVCSMYKTPQRFSPHSNLLSNELSRDSKELQKPVISNSAVLRFYRYIQAARDGQDQKDCLRLYPSCTVNTER